MTYQDQENSKESEKLLKHLRHCEELISNCAMDKFSDLRFELKQLKEKLRMLNQSNRLR